MTKLKMVLLFVVPLMESAAGMLETIDTNSTGKDDVAAKALRAAVAAIRELQKEA